MRTIGFLILALAMAAVLLSACGDDGVGIDVGFDDEGGDALPPEIQGQALLENMSEHSGISVEIEELGVNLVTDSSGEFSLLSELAEGEWTLQAAYPFFRSADESFTVINGRPESELEAMSLAQEVVFNVYTDKLVYGYGETVFITLEAENVTDYEIALVSLTSPMAAFAVRYNEETVVGGLFPGQGSEPQEVDLAPGDLVTFNLSWTIDNFDLEPGEYRIFAALTDSGNYPDYFTPDSELAAELNASLYAKLTPATIAIADE